MKKVLLLSVFTVLAFATTAHAADIDITQSDRRFSEDALKIKPGDRIVFKNADKVTHNIQVINSDGAVDDKGLQKPGETVEETIGQAGEYKIHCGIHPGMKIKVTVE